MLIPYLVTYLLIALAIVGGLAALGVIGYVAYWYVHNWRSPVTRVPARVVRKRDKKWDVSVVGETPEMAAARLATLGRDPKRAAKAWNKLARIQYVPELTLAEGTDFYITFAFGEREQEFAVPESVYAAANEGDEGLLVFRGEQFERFIRGLK